MKENLYSDNCNFFNWRFGKIFYTKKGTGSPVLLIHDLDCSSSDSEWRQILFELSKDHTVYTIDLLGCGRSDKPKITYTNYLYLQLISDFIKNIIKHKTDIVVTGKSSSFVLMACYIDSQLFDKIVLINPEDISDSCKYPKYKHKLLKHLIDSPILGTFIYNIIFSKAFIKENFSLKYFYNGKKIRKKQIQRYHEAAHLGGSSAKYLYSSIRCYYSNTNIIHALKELNNSIYIIGGKEEAQISKIIDDYTLLNSSIETLYISNCKHLPQLESPSELLEIIQLYLS